MSDTKSELNPEILKLAAGLLTLSDATLKRWLIDSYGQQLASARNYLWVASIILTGCMAFIDLTKPLEAFKNLSNPSAHHLLILFITVIMFFAIVILIVAIFKGLSIGYEMNAKEYERYLEHAETPDGLRELCKTVKDSAGNIPNKEILDFYLEELSLNHEIIKISTQGQYTRCQMLKSIGLGIRSALICIVFASLLYLISLMLQT